MENIKKIIRQYRGQIVAVIQLLICFVAVAGVCKPDKYTIKMKKLAYKEQAKTRKQRASIKSKERKAANKLKLKEKKLKEKMKYKLKKQRLKEKAKRKR